MRSEINRTAHAIAMRHEQEVRQALETAVQALKAAGARPETIRDFLIGCAAAGRVLEASNDEH